MVRRFGISQKGSSSRDLPGAFPPFPPPPYEPDEHAPSLVIGGTTTTTTHVVTTTTQTTTNFFSLPLWRRRPPAASTVFARRSMSGMDADESGALGRMSNISMPMLNKDLPPTPTSSDDDLLAPSNEGTSDSNYPRDRALHRTPPITISRPMNPSPSRLSSKSSSPHPSPQPTVVLAQAALGIGLPHVMPRASTSSSRSEANTLAFMNISQHEGHHDSKVRRVKSSQKLSAHSSAENLSPADPRGRRRTRGISLGPTVLQDAAIDVKGKGKEKELAPDSTLPRKSLARRASFWNRKRNESMKSQLEPAVSLSSQHSLPFLPPVSPFRMDTNMDSPSASSSQDHPSLRPPPGLIRRHSASNSPLPSPGLPHEVPDNVVPSAIPEPSTGKRNLRRPSTADSARSRAHSLFIDSLPSSFHAPASLPPTPEAPSKPSHSHPRQRAQTNPPLLHRLSVNLLSFTSSSPSPSTFGLNATTQSPTASPRPSISQPPVDVPKPNRTEETPEVYLSRLTNAVSKAEVATVLASSDDSFHLRALRVYIDRFEFNGDPLDVALRKLLMDVGLPRETQQIDRVMEAFAARYRQCNPSLFASDDHPYILAFSLIMLHTDAFNKSNKRKMTRPDYIKNTRLPGVAPEVLECFYDNIVFAPFIFIEDPLDVNGQRGLTSDITPSRVLPGMTSQHSLPVSGGAVTLLGKSTKIDPYYLITNNLLDPLRVNVAAYVPPQNPYTSTGTGGAWDELELRQAFAKAGVIEVGPMDNRRMSTAFLSLSIGGFPAPYPSLGIPDGLLPPSSSNDVSMLKVTKVGLLNRKDASTEGGKRVLTKKWRPWSVILTGSQLLFFRDLTWAPNLLEQAKSSDGQLSSPASLFKPDELLTVRDAVAVYDRSYDKSDHTFRFVMGDGRQFLLQSTDEQDMNEWISRINYASAFKTNGIRMRPVGMSGKDVELMGVAAAASYLREMQTPQIKTLTSNVHTFDNRHSAEFLNHLPSSPSSSLSPNKLRKVKAISGRSDMDLEVPTAPAIDGASQFVATFDQVKADLAAGRWTIVDDLPLRTDIRPRAHSLELPLRPFLTTLNEGDILKSSSRTQVMRSKLQDMESRIAATQSQLDSDLRFVRNVAALTPFQRTTRDRLDGAVQNVAKRIKQARLDIIKFMCHRDIMNSDILAEERDWYRTKTIALKAATETLHSRRDPSVPRMTLSLHLDDQDYLSTSPRDIPSSATATHSRRPESSTGESFHSALDFEWSTTTPDDVAGSGLNSPLADSPLMTPLTEDGSHNASSSYPFLQSDSSATSTARSSLDPRHLHRQSSQSSTVDGLARPLHERFVTAPEMPEEEAEEWNRTRAAKRVSLVRMPSQLRLSVPFTRSGESVQESSRVAMTSHPIKET